MNADEAKATGMLFYCPPADLKPEMVDPLLWPAVQAINASGWVWTAESCQGHPDDEDGMPWAFNTSPFLRLVTREENVGRMLAALVRAAQIPDDPLSTHVLELATHRIKDGWTSTNVYVRAHTVRERNRGCQAFERFGEIVRASDNSEPRQSK